jgi:hypothetical protein
MNSFLLRVSCHGIRTMIAIAALMLPLGAMAAALHRNILDVFNEHGVQIMTPAYEGDPEQPKLVPKDQWYAAPAKSPGAR